MGSRTGSRSPPLTRRCRLPRRSQKHRSPEPPTTSSSATCSTANGSTRLVDLDLPAARTAQFVARYGPMLTRSIIGRLHVSAPNAQVLHIHDPLAWWPGDNQPITLNRILTTAEYDPEAALAARGTGPHHSDPHAALDAFAIPIQATALWRWPYSPHVDYLACATLTDCG